MKRSSLPVFALLLLVAACAVPDLPVPVGGGGAGMGGASTGTPMSTGGATSTGGNATTGGGIGGSSGTGGSPDGAVPDHAAGDSGTTGGELDGEADASSVDPTTCSPQCSGTKPFCDNGTCVECMTASGRCSGNTPSRCVNAHWEDQAPCSGQTPACNNGICTGAKLTGGIVTVVNGVLAAGDVHLVEHGLEYTSTVCGMISGKQVCVTGGVRP